MAGVLVDAFKYRGRFFEILQQTERSQTAVMTVGPGQDAGPEEAHGGDQVVYIIEGDAVIRVAGRKHRAGPGGLLMIPAGTPHHVANPGKIPLFFERPSPEGDDARRSCPPLTRSIRPLAAPRAVSAGRAC